MSKSTKAVCALAALLVLLVWPLWATATTQAEPGQKELEALLVKVGRNYAKTQSLECHFRQKSRTGGRVREGRGKAFFFRPTSTGDSVIRWEYALPVVQTIVNDGREIRIYTPVDRQMLVSPAAGADTDMAYALFTGKSTLTATFTVAPGDPDFQLDPAPAGLQALVLVPKNPQSQLKRAQIWLNREARIERILMEDHFEALTELSFDGMRFDSIRPSDTARIAELRSITTPADTQIIRQ